MIDTIKQIWPVITAIVVYIVWLIRLESKITSGSILFENHKKACSERHEIENNITLKNNEDMKKAIDSLFVITMDLSNCIHEFKGILEGAKKK